MARAKEKETLTPEERLQAALVPDWEQPYKVPENWCWVKLSSLSKLISKGTTPKGGKGSYTNDGVKFLRVENINDDGTISHENIVYVSEEIHKTFLKRSILEENDILISIAGTLGKTGIVRNVDLPMNTNQAVAFIRIALDKINVKYIKNAIDSPVIQDLLLGKTKVTSIPNLTLEIIGECPLPLPPLPEQQRIVDRIESLFAKLDEAKQKAQDALDSFETRKAAILHKAFTGELTARWRKEHGVGMESWKETRLGKYVDSQYGYTERAFQEQIGPKFLRITDIQNGIVNWDDVPFCKISDSDFERYAVSKNDILIARTGATTGKSYLIVDDVEAVFASYLVRIKIKSAKLSPQYLYCFLQSQMYWSQITKFSAGIAQPGVNAKKLKEIILPIPAVPEQTEVVRILDDFLAKEQQAKEAAERVLEQIDLMKKSILARAFCGELGTNDPTEESALELLKEVM